MGWQGESKRQRSQKWLDFSRSVGFARRIDLLVCALPSPTGRGDGLAGKLQVAEKPKMLESQHPQFPLPVGEG